MNKILGYALYIVICLVIVFVIYKQKNKSKCDAPKESQLISEDNSSKTFNMAEEIKILEKIQAEFLSKN